MCAQFTQKVERIQDFISLFQVIRPHLLSDFEVPGPRILPYNPALVIRKNKTQNEILPMSFSLVPRWSKEARVKFATHNARLETVDEKASFKDAFKKRHCLIPITNFIEPIYVGEFKGNMVKIGATANSSVDSSVVSSVVSVMLACGIWEEWQHPHSGECLESFSILTRSPLPFVEKIGHDRSPIFLTEERALEWINLESQDSAQYKKFLNESFIEPNLEASIDRPLKAGWEKRIS